MLLGVVSCRSRHARLRPGSSGGVPGSRSGSDTGTLSPQRYQRLPDRGPPADRARCAFLYGTLSGRAGTDHG
jgi:hypothetical protein